MIDLKKRSAKILVIGDLIIDKYLWGDCTRISPEAPVQIINIENEDLRIGGAGNVVSNLKALGASVDIISTISNCENSDTVKKLLSNISVDTKYLIFQEDSIIPKKTRIIASQQQVVRYDQESTKEISINTQDQILKTFDKLVKNYDLILLSDYGKGLLTKKLTQSIIKTANRAFKKVLIDPKGSDYSKYIGAYTMTPNRLEASHATRINIEDEDSLKKAIIQIKTDCKLEISMITLSESGVAVYDESLKIHPTYSKEVFDVTGAGDTILAALGFGLACGYLIDEAVKFANLAAGVVVSKIGSSSATLDEIIEYEFNSREFSSKSNIKSIKEIDLLSKELNARGKKIIFTNGCFDILHVGHIRYLEKAKNFGDVLIVGINSDESVKRLKGDSRPINTQIDRAQILASIQAVDYVVIFKEDNPYNLIKTILPHTLVKGGDYLGQKIIGEDLVDELKLVDFIENKSTSNTIKKILKNK